MSFVWTSVTAGVTKTLPSHFNEVKTAVDTILSNLGATPYSWSIFPVAQNQIITYTSIIELRNALDYADGSNTCTSHNTTQNSTHNSALCTTHNTNVETANNASDYSSYNNSIETGNNASNYSSYNSNIETGNNASNHSNYYSNVETGNNAVNYSSYYFDHRTSVHVTRNAAA